MQKKRDRAQTSNDKTKKNCTSIEKGSVIKGGKSVKRAKGGKGTFGLCSSYVKKKGGPTKDNLRDHQHTFLRGGKEELRK